jgi:hypothetical protein
VNAETPRSSDWVSVFQIVVGIAMLGLWAVLVATGQVPEIDAGEVGIWFHLTAELLTAILLIWAGWRARRGRAMGLSALALGALVYTSIASAGYYADLGEWMVVTMFILLTVVTGAAIRRVLSIEPVAAT